MNSSAAYLRTAVKGVASGTLSTWSYMYSGHWSLITLKGSLGSEVRVILKVTLAELGAAMVCNGVLVTLGELGV